MPRAAKVSTISTPRATTPYVRNATSGRVRQAAKPLNLLPIPNLSSTKCPFPQCDQGPAREGDLGRHLMTHIKALQYQCPWPDCNEPKAQWNNMRTHMDVHAVVKRHRCEACDRSFSDAATLHRHRRRRACLKNKAPARESSVSEPHPSPRLRVTRSTASTSSASEVRAPEPDLHDGPIAGPSNRPHLAYGRGLGVPAPSYNGLALDFGGDVGPQLLDISDQQGFWAVPGTPCIHHDLHTCTVTPVFIDEPSGFYPGGNPAFAGVANGQQYRNAGPSAPAAPQVLVHPQHQAGGDLDVYFGLDEFRPASPPPIAQPIPVPVFQPVPPPAFQPVPPQAFPPPFANLDPAPAHETRPYVPYMLGHLYEPAQHEWFDVFRNVPVVQDPRNGSPAYAADLAFYTAQLPTGHGFALNYLPETSPNFIHASEAAGWFTSGET